MNKTAFTKRWAALFAVFLLVLSNLAFVQPSVQAATLEKAVTIKAIDENGEVVLPLTAVSFEEGETAYDVLLEAGEKKGKEIDTTHGEYGAFINSIGETSPTGNAYWSFNINGVSASTGISSHKVASGEHLLFAITEWPNPTVTAKVSAVGKNGVEVIPETNVTLIKGASAYDALIQAAVQHGVSVQATVDDTYFTYINNVGDTEIGSNDWWGVGVNDNALSTSIVAHEVQPNDHVQLTVQTYVPPSEPGTAEPAEPSEPAQPTDPEEPVDPHETNPIKNEEIEDNISDILSYMETKNITTFYGNEWWVWGLANTTREIPATYVTSVKEKVKEVDGNFRNVLDLEKVIIGLSAAGYDATSIEGYNLVDLLVNHASLQNSSINMNIYALLAVDSAQYKTPEGFREQQVNAILSRELAGGGWSFFGSNPSPDITGMVLTALAPYRNQADVQMAIDRAVNYLSDVQGETGGFTIASNGGDSSESISQAIVGLASVGVDPTGQSFTKAGGNLILHLLKFKQNDGGFSHLQAGASSDMSTQQVLLALTAYQSFVNNNGLVYQFELVNKPGAQPAEPNQPVETNPSDEQNQPVGLDKNGQTVVSTDDTGETSESAEGNKLPNTATNTANLMVIGLGVLLVGLILFYVKRKRVS
ncbi:LPXTG-motif cell wall-anchored protein [Neobacillus niacini]|uniref:DUF4430 domain-containing protein n=1 Tax=Neobacillus driksii TaxID=3035913 RepID=UPI00277DEAA3|nr:DUF4430 domain-containing protein [Neobacillus niacini]MDQ0972365.1 LPXTG-motif cell wall-anchored protein [Neobacillus niacini]